MSTTRTRLIVNSADRQSGTSSSFNVIFNPTITDIQSYYLEWVQIPFTYYTITTSNNQIRYEDIGGTTYTVSIPVGSYTQTNFLTAIKTAMDGSASPDVYTVTADATTAKITIATTGIYELLWAGLANSLAPCAGFDATDLTGVATYTAQNVFNLSGASTIKVRSSLASGSQINGLSSSGQDGTHLAYVPVSSNFGGTIFYRGLEIRSVESLDMISSIHFELRNGDTDELIDLNGRDWTMSIVLDRARR